MIDLLLIKDNKYDKKKKYLKLLTISSINNGKNQTLINKQVYINNYHKIFNNCINENNISIELFYKTK